MLSFTYLYNSNSDASLLELLVVYQSKASYNFWLFSSEENKEGMFVLTKHGGHLGFYEGGLIWPNKTTWLEHALLEYIIAMDDAVQSPNTEENANDDGFRESRKCFSI